ncbi:heparan sulfate glucosamine 3-O-sulfotransferase 2-like [Ciona intestinalis]
MVQFYRKYVYLCVCLSLMLICLSLTKNANQASISISNDGLSVGYQFPVMRGKSKSNEAKPLRVGFLGVEKCGTQALFEFARQHPYIYFLTGEHICKHPSNFKDESASFRDKYKVIAFRDNSCWKNPSAFDRHVSLRPHKIVILLCDPVYRAFSMYMHHVDFNPKDREYGSFDQCVSNEINYLDGIKLRILQGKTVKGSKRRSSFADFVSNVHGGPLPIVSLGIYSLRLVEFLKRYQRKDILILSGETLLKDPGSLMLELQSFLGLHPYITPKSFYVNASTNLHCMNSVSNHQVCLYKKKSRTRGENKPTPEPTVIEKLSEFYRPFNKQLYATLNQTFDWV